MRLTSVSRGKVGWLLRHPGFKRAPLRVLAGVARWELVRLRGQETTLRLANGEAITVAPDDGVGRGIAYFGQHDRQIAELVGKVLRPGDRFVDAGANVGSMTLWAAPLVGAGGKVIAFEPNPETARRLTRNAARFPWIDVRGEALGATDGQARFAIRADSARSGLADGSGEPGTITVPLRRLDGLLDAPVRLLKVDAEGHDDTVLEGAQGLLRRGAVDYVVAEAAERRAETTALLASCGYTLKGVLPSGDLVEPDFPAATDVLAVGQGLPLP